MLMLNTLTWGEYLVSPCQVAPWPHKCGSGLGTIWLDLPNPNFAYACDASYCTVPCATLAAVINGVDYMINSADNLVHTPDGFTGQYDVETDVNAQLALTMSTVHRTDIQSVGGSVCNQHLWILLIFYTLYLFLHLIIFPSDPLEVLYLLEDLTFEVLQILIHRLEKMRHPSSEDPNSE